MTEKVSVAFVWHMHQPIYKNVETDEYLMPWVRLHAIKDYLNMLLLLEKFPDIKQTFNLVPSLIEQIEDYGFNGAKERHYKLTDLHVDELTDDDKKFIFDHFFDANYVNMIAPHPHYKVLYEKRFQQENISYDSFSDQEYSDILAWFNLAWFHSYWVEKNEELKRIYEKGCNYTLEDRKDILRIQKEIIRSIIPKYKEMYEKGQIEISTSPYYHPILPLLIDSSSAKRATPNIELPQKRIKFKDDAIDQTVKGIEKFKEIFGKAPDGIWPSEQAISPECLEVMSNLGIKWTITDEGVLAKTINKEFIRDFHGDLVDPFDLSKVYQVETDKNNIFVLFRNSVLADLIGFEYGNHSPDVAANDLYERIKNIQEKLQHSPEKHHIITIALDGENCWESYEKNGETFLTALYNMFIEDETIDITTISDFIKKVSSPTKLKTIHSGSWINRDYRIWIGDSTKNLAWNYLSKTRNDLLEVNKKDYPDELIQKAWQQIYVAEGSDWFWWYGEPNDSGQDDLFDLLFRTRLKNVYKILNLPIPLYLESSLDISVGRVSKTPRGIITPLINGEINSDNEWAKAGCIEISHTPMYQADRLLRRVCFGNDLDNMYFRLDLDPNVLEKSLSDIYTNEVLFYFYIPDYVKSLSPIRLRSKGVSSNSTQRFSYVYEIETTINQGHILPPILSESIDGNLWKIKMSHNLIYSYKSVLTMAIPFDDLELQKGQSVHFSIAMARSGILQEMLPQNNLLSIHRPI